MGERELLSEGNGGLEQSSIFGDSRQHQLLSFLLRQSQPMTERDLAVQLAGGENPSSAVTDGDIRSLLIDFHHRCLPKLEAEGLIERYPEGIVAAESLSFDDENSSFPGLQNPDHPAWEAVRAVTARPRRQALVSALASHRRSLTVEELETELVDGECRSWTTEGESDDSATLILLHHIDLPKLADVGLIEYEHETNTIIPDCEMLRLVNRLDFEGVSETAD